MMLSRYAEPALIAHLTTYTHFINIYLTLNQSSVTA